MPDVGLQSLRWFRASEPILGDPNGIRDEPDALCGVVVDQVEGGLERVLDHDHPDVILAACDQRRSGLEGDLTVIGCVLQIPSSAPYHRVDQQSMHECPEQIATP